MISKSKSFNTSQVDKFNVVDVPTLSFPKNLLMSFLIRLGISPIEITLEKQDGAANSHIEFQKATVTYCSSNQDIQKYVGKELPLFDPECMGVVEGVKNHQKHKKVVKNVNKIKVTDAEVNDKKMKRSVIVFKTAEDLKECVGKNFNTQNLPLKLRAMTQEEAQSFYAVKIVKDMRQWSVYCEIDTSEEDFALYFPELLEDSMADEKTGDINSCRIEVKKGRVDVTCTDLDTYEFLLKFEDWEHNDHKFDFVPLKKQSDIKTEEEVKNELEIDKEDVKWEPAATSPSVAKKTITIPKKNIHKKKPIVCESPVMIDHRKPVVHRNRPVHQPNGNQPSVNPYYNSILVDSIENISFETNPIGEQEKPFLNPNITGSISPRSSVQKEQYLDLFIDNVIIDESKGVKNGMNEVMNQIVQKLGDPFKWKSTISPKKSFCFQYKNSKKRRESYEFNKDRIENNPIGRRARFKMDILVEPKIPDVEKNLSSVKKKISDNIYDLKTIDFTLKINFAGGLEIVADVDTYESYEKVAKTFETKLNTGKLYINENPYNFHFFAFFRNLYLEFDSKKYNNTTEMKDDLYNTMDCKEGIHSVEELDNFFAFTLTSEELFKKMDTNVLTIIGKGGKQSKAYVHREQMKTVIFRCKDSLSVFPEAGWLKNFQEKICPFIMKVRFIDERKKTLVLYVPFGLEEKVFERMKKDLKKYLKNNNPKEIKISEICQEFDERWYESAPALGTLDMYKGGDHDFYKKKFSVPIFLKEKGKAEKGKNFRRDIRPLLKTVQLDTIKHVRNGFYEYNGEKIPIPSSIIKTRKYGDTKEVKMPKLHKQTVVKVVEEDCLVCYENMIKSGAGLRPLLLNMANQTRKGGSWLEGARAQEEDIFRRSTYYKSLQPEFDLDIKSTPYGAEFVYDGAGSLSDLKGENFQRLQYPIDFFGTIHSENVLIFRDTEENGYNYLKKPFAASICALPAIRQTKYKENIEMHEIIILKKRLESLFNVAIKHGNDSLVLSAWGCGAYKNPPKIIAEVFKSAIMQYNKVFKEIWFAIVGRGNNFTIFKNILEDDKSYLDDYEPMPMGVDRPLSGENEYKVKGEICEDLGNCVNDECRKKKYHPPKCNHPVCKNFSKTHQIIFSHKKVCDFGARCVEFGAKHEKKFSHPKMCQNFSKCTRYKDTNHLLSERHYPVCSEFGLINNEDDKHCALVKSLTPSERKFHFKNFWHVPSKCEFGDFCPFIFDEVHNRKFYHCHRKMCVCPLRCPKEKNADHMRNFSHLCPYGDKCKKLNDLEHKKLWFHIKKKACDKGRNCLIWLKKQCPEVIEKHLDSYSHKDAERDFRYKCKHGSSCTKKNDVRHILGFSHSPQLYPPGVSIPLYGKNSKIDFADNLKKMRNEMSRIRVDPSIVEWLKTLRPVHRCWPNIVKSILEDGQLLSNEKMSQLDSHVIQSTGNINKLSQEIEKKLDYEENFQEEYKMDEIKGYIINLTEYYVCVEQKNTTKQKEKAEDVKKYEERLVERGLNDVTKEYLKGEIQANVKKSFTLLKKPTGIKFINDKKLGTNEHIFSIFGPNTTEYGNVHFVLSPLVFFHPDFNTSPAAGTSFFNNFSNTFGCPWRKPDSTNEHDKIKNFHRSKYHPAVGNFYEDIAKELVKKVSDVKRRKWKSTNPHRVSLKDVKDFYYGKKTGRIHVDSHDCFEGHLPAIVPLQFVEKMIVPHTVLDEFNTEHKESLEKAFGPNWRSKIFTYDDKNNRDRAIHEDQNNEYYNSNIDLKGFMFEIDYKKHIDKEVCVPIRLNGLGSSVRHIYFEAIGRCFSLIFSRKQSGTWTRERSGLFVFFGSEENGGRSVYNSHFISEERPCSLDLIPRAKKLSEVKNFNWALNEREAVEYHLMIGNGQIVLEHCSPHNLLNDKILTSKIDHVRLSKMKFVSIMVHKFNVGIRNFRIVKKEEKRSFLIKEKVPDPVLNPTLKSRKNKVAKKFKSTNKMQDDDDDNEDSFKKDTGFGDKIIETIQKGKKFIKEVFQKKEKEECKKGNQCEDKTRKHLKNFIHPYKTICSDTKTCELFWNRRINEKRKHINDHFEDFTHYCNFGPVCRNINGECKHNIHVDIPICSPGCRDLSAKHRTQFAHKGERCILKKCIHGKKCNIYKKYQDSGLEDRKSIDHMKMYFH